MEKLLSILKYNKPNMNMLLLIFIIGVKILPCIHTQCSNSYDQKLRINMVVVSHFQSYPRAHFIICHDYLYYYYRRRNEE